MAIQAISAALPSIFFIGLSLLLVYCWRWRRYFELGMKLPGPPALPLLGNGLDFTTKNLCKFFQEFTEFARTYVPVARLWFGPVLVVVLTDPNHIEKVVKHDKVGSRGYLFTKLMRPAFRNGLFLIDGDKWRAHRKIVSSALNTKVLETFVENFAKNSDILANKLKALADGNTAHDIDPYFTRGSLDIIFQTSSHIDINAQEGQDNVTLNAKTTIIETLALRITKPWLYIEWIFNLTKLGTKYYNSVKHCHDTINNVILRKKITREAADKRDLHHEKPSLMDIFLQYGEMKKEDIIGELTTIVGAGAETTSTACCFMLALLGENQHIQEKVMQEQEDIFSDDILRPVRSDDLPRMVYLEQVFKEAMRLFPPVPVHSREAIKEIDLGHGHIVPAGALIWMPAYVIHRDPKHFPEPEKFDPDRFSPENSEGRHPYAYTPFGIGRRMCVGHEYATMEAKTILSTVLRRYCITEIEGGIRGIQETLKLSFVLSNANGIRVKLLPRSYPS